MQPIKQVKNLAGKRVLVRVDFNVPVKNGKVVDDFKIQKSLPTIKFLMKQGAKVILVSHLGRPKGVDKKLSLAPVAKVLEKLLKKKVGFVGHAELVSASRSRNKFGMTEQMWGKETGVVLLENIRFLPGEGTNSLIPAKKLASLADVFVLDGFAVAHRDSASVSGVTKFLPSYAGLLLFEEVTSLMNVMEGPKRPLVVMLGGAKVETKIPVLKYFLSKADHVLVGGEIANTYWWAKGGSVGASLIGKKYKKEVLKYCSNKKVILPVDVVVGKENGKDVKVVEVGVKGERLRVKGKEAVYDIGPATVRLFSKYIKGAKTLIWNGAMGRFEQHPYEYGTYALAHLFAARSKGKAYGVCGGGETVEVFKKLNLFQDVDLASTGGGAMLEFLSGKKLPGLEALRPRRLEALRRSLYTFIF
ncbi:MAG: phosphoglycerate kinase [Candidatus Magasanikbacteria bacterium RIFCSPHIGHO2_01_FULL_47_8]|uniref:Phosphoglycerate kinase n=1 Tax=Candidatus Magasanikbacteria bacterium RIFCSPHIGHO2_01_FULL_47_8 TaxID=1798673 RepID=A0A1F6MB57_9BACT|nr:MAG: phosphoglycerate kinase [Candidatus Magasanikbacteria bacterium RIFCSPHIGHO2_01_FULL_47_8]